MERIPLELKPGDLFGTRNPMALGCVISALQWLWSHDGESTYTHSGIIVSAKGETYEALWKVGYGTLTNYVGDRIIIARHTPLSVETFYEAFLRLKARHDGQWYPLWRLGLNILPPLAKFLTWRRGSYVVCSELVAELEFLLGFRHAQFTGTNPDTLADEWRRWKEWDVLGEGVLGFENDQFFIEGC